MTLHELLTKYHIIPRRLTAKEIALSGVMAAVMAVAAFIPVTVVVGVGKVISAAVMLEPLIGVLLGPVLGTYAAAAGAFVGQIIAPQGNIFHYLTFIPPTVGTATAGLLAHNHWKGASGIMVGVLLLWYSTSIGRELYYYPYMLLIFLGLILLFRDQLGDWIHVKYNEILGFRGAGMGIMIVGLILLIAGQIIFFVYAREGITAGVVSTAVAVLLLLGYIVRGDTVSKKVSAAAFLSGAAILVLVSIFGVTSGSYHVYSVLLLLSIVFILLALLLAGYESLRYVFLGSFALFCAAAVIVILQTPGEDEPHILLQKITYILILAGGFLLYVHLHHTIEKKWAGAALCTAGFLGVIQQVLLFSLDSQVIRTELRQLEKLIPFSTLVSGQELPITSVADYYLKKVVPIYVTHIGLFLIFVALLIIGISFFLNISLEKLSVSYFIIAGAAVLSDLMIGNYLAIQVLDLSSGIFSAFLFIYPVERMFMAFFSTIFGVGVFIPLKKYGFNNMIRR
jgi:hypothetical protein